GWPGYGTVTESRLKRRLQPMDKTRPRLSWTRTRENTGHAGFRAGRRGSGTSSPVTEKPVCPKRHPRKRHPLPSTTTPIWHASIRRPGVSSRRSRALVAVNHTPSSNPWLGQQLPSDPRLVQDLGPLHVHRWLDRSARRGSYFLSEPFPGKRYTSCFCAQLSSTRRRISPFWRS